MTEHNHHPACNYCNDKKEILVEHEHYYNVVRCSYCKSPITIKHNEQPKSTPISIKFPEPKTWTEDKAMTVNPGSDNYKMGFNDAIREVKRLNEAAQSQSTPTLQELDEEKVYKFINDEMSDLKRLRIPDYIFHKLLYPSSGVDNMYKQEQQIRDLSKRFCSTFGIKPELSKEVTDVSVPTLQELDEIKSNILYRHKVSPNNFEEYLNGSFKNLKDMFKTPKIEPSKEVTENEVLELAQWIAFESGEQTSPERLADALYRLGYRRQKEVSVEEIYNKICITDNENYDTNPNMVRSDMNIRIANAIHSLITRTPNAKNNEG